MVGGFYDRVNQDSGVKNIYGFNADANFDKVWVGGEWLKASNLDAVSYTHLNYCTGRNHEKCDSSNTKSHCVESDEWR